MSGGTQDRSSAHKMFPARCQTCTGHVCFLCLVHIGRQAACLKNYSTLGTTTPIQWACSVNKHDMSGATIGSTTSSIPNPFANVLNPQTFHQLACELAFHKHFSKDFHLLLTTPLDLNATRVRPHLVALDNRLAHKKNPSDSIINPIKHFSTQPLTGEMKYPTNLSLPCAFLFISARDATQASNPHHPP